MSNTTIGIIGAGRFGLVLEALFQHQPNFLVKIASTSLPTDNKRIFKLDQVLGCDIVIPAIPVSQLENWLKSNQANIISANNSNPDQVWMSVCSVMEMPSLWFEECQPKTIKTCSSHPVFGPASTMGGTKFEGLPWVLDKRLETSNSPIIQTFKSYCQSRGISLLYFSPQDHDKLMARSQAVAFLFGDLGKQLRLSEGILDTVGFKHLMSNQKIYQGDSRQLLLDMFTYNRFARETLGDLKESLTSFEAEIQNSVYLREKTKADSMS